MFNYRSIGFSLLVLILLAGAGCDNSFDPKTDFVRRIVVFSALDPTAPYQAVRLEATYDAEVTNPDRPVDQIEITEADVRISSDKGTVVLRDTVITLQDGTKRTIWITRDITPREGIVYSLRVKVPDVELVSAETTVPSRSYVRATPGNGGVLIGGLSGTVSPPGGFYFRLFVLGTKMVDGKEIELRREVPIAIDEKTEAYTYSAPSRKYEQGFSNTAIMQIRDQLRQEEGVSGRMLLAVGYTFDNFLYGYYKAVRGFEDPVSVRQDMPNVTNIRGGVGVFGAVYSDSTRFVYSTSG